MYSRAFLNVVPYHKSEYVVDFDKLYNFTPSAMGETIFDILT